MYLELWCKLNLCLLQFQLTLQGLESRTLWLTVWHSDMFGRNDFLGEVMMSLENVVFDEPNPKWYPLQERVSLPTTSQTPMKSYVNFISDGAVRRADLVQGRCHCGPEIRSARGLWKWHQQEEKQAAQGLTSRPGQGSQKFDRSQVQWTLRPLLQEVQLIFC
jgi:C2 domain